MLSFFWKYLKQLPFPICWFTAKYSGQTRKESWHSSKLNQTNCGGSGGDDDDDDDDDQYGNSDNDDDDCDEDLESDNSDKFVNQAWVWAGTWYWRQSPPQLTLDL